VDNDVNNGLIVDGRQVRRWRFSELVKKSSKSMCIQLDQLVTQFSTIKHEDRSTTSGAAEEAAIAYPRSCA